MTLRNWAIGYYIVEYEQDGSDRAEYGSHLLKNLEKQIDQKGMNYTLFKACRQFYKVYPQIGSTVSSEFKLPDFGKSSTVSNEFVTDPDVLVNNLSFSHIREIMVLNDAFERFFYETECMKCNWNVRKLRRQIKTNLCNGVQREHNKKLNNGLPILHKVPPKRDYGRYFCIMAEKGGTSHGGLTEKLSPFFHAKKQEVNAYGR